MHRFITMLLGSFLFFLLLCNGATLAAAQEFLLGPYGARVGHNPYPGYTPLTLHDLQAAEFVSSYNAAGITLASPFPTLPSNFCPFLAVAGNSFAAFGSPLQLNPTLLAPFTSAGTLASQPSDYPSGSGSPPMWVGLVNSQNFDNNTYEPSLNAAFTAQFFALSMANLNTQLCDASNTLAIYRKAAFFLAPYGSNFPEPPSVLSGAVFATLADVRTEVFAAPVNLNGLPTYGADSVPNVCCTIRVSEGYLTTAGGSSIAPFDTNSGTIECPASTLPAVVKLGTANDGGFPLQYFSTLNYSILQSFTAPTTPPSVCSASEVNVWGLYKISSLPAPTPAPGPVGNCYDMEVQVSYYLPDGTICLAVVYRTYMQLNVTYRNMVMSGLNECAGSIGPVSAFDVEIAPYSDTHLIGRTTGATACNCQGGGVNLWGLIPINESGHSEMTTICSLPIQEFYFCNVLMYTNKGPVQCP